VKGRPVVVAVRPGRYAVVEPIVLTDEDSGLHFVGCGFEQSVFDGIGFEHAAFRIPKDGLPSAQSACNIAQAAVRADDAENVVLEKCR